MSDTERMSDERLAEIVEADSHGADADSTWPELLAALRAERAEVDRLTAELAEARAERDWLAKNAEHVPFSYSGSLSGYGKAQVRARLAAAHAAVRKEGTT